MKKSLFIASLVVFILGLSIVETTIAQKSFVGTVKQRPDDGYGCYFTLPENFGESFEKRRYLFFSTDTGALMNINGQDVSLKYSISKEVKSLKKRRRFVWIYKNDHLTAKFNLTVTGRENEGSDLYYDALITVIKGDEQNSIAAKGFCGG